MGADCGTAAVRANTGFVDSTARLNMAIELGGEEFDRQSLRFFRGERRSCRIRWGGLADCCKNSGALVGLAGCTRGERLLAEERHAGNTHYLGRGCARRIFGVCVRWRRSWCVFGSKLGRILQEAARGQLGIGWGNCRGFTVEEMERIDFEAVDLSEFTENLLDGSREPSIELPEAGRTGAVMRRADPRLLHPKRVRKAAMTIPCAPSPVSSPYFWRCPLTHGNGGPGAGRRTPSPPLGWHFYCDRNEEDAEEEKQTPPSEKPSPSRDRHGARPRDAPGPGGGAGPGRPGPERRRT